MDVFGSNATPMGGSAGRADALIGAVEAQKAEGVLHLHMNKVHIAKKCIPDLSTRDLN
jgi:hypothetical protein